jgi:hypothetical protein
MVEHLSTLQAHLPNASVKHLTWTRERCSSCAATVCAVQCEASFDESGLCAAGTKDYCDEYKDECVHVKKDCKDGDKYAHFYLIDCNYAVP